MLQRKEQWTLSQRTGIFTLVAPFICANGFWLLSSEVFIKIILTHLIITTTLFLLFYRWEEVSHSSKIFRSKIHDVAKIWTCPIRPQKASDYNHLFVLSPADITSLSLHFCNKSILFNISLFFLTSNKKVKKVFQIVKGSIIAGINFSKE